MTSGAPSGSPQRKAAPVDAKRDATHDVAPDDIAAAPATSVDLQPANALPADARETLAHLVRHAHDGLPSIFGHFDLSQPLSLARAPGRLDLMGGIADYSGSEVLQWPLKEAAVVMAQTRTDQQVHIISSEPDGAINRPVFTADMATLACLGQPHSGSLINARNWFSTHEQGRWGAYIAGSIPVLVQALNARFDTGISIFLHSRVPEGKGVSSSAAIEVATMRAIVHAFGLKLDGHTLALLCQRLENEVVGAPCGLMDQMTSSVGRKGELLSLLCQPDIVQAPVRLPTGLGIWAIDSGLRHAVTGADYASVRIGAFMGYRMLLERAGIAAASIPADQLHDTLWHGYLGNLTPSEFNQYFAHTLPQTMTGAEFLQRFDRLPDRVTTIDPSVTYAVRQPTAHPIHEHHRVRLFRELLVGCLPCGSDPESASAVSGSVAPHPGAFQLAGECMYQSHASYSACGIGSSGTDDLMQRLRKAGPSAGVYGARITGGGSGGAVAVLGQVEAGVRIHQIAEDYARDCDMGGQVFSGSSHGASAWHVRPTS